MKFRLRVEVTASNDKGKGTALSAVTAIVDPKTAIVNTRPTLRIISVRFLGARVYARFRICDDKPRNLSIIETDSRPGKAPLTRRFSTIVPPQPFRGKGRFTITLRARDTSGSTSLPGEQDLRALKRTTARRGP